VVDMADADAGHQPKQSESLASAECRRAQGSAYVLFLEWIFVYRSKNLVPFQYTVNCATKDICVSASTRHRVDLVFASD
jgi:hypothetical protein